MSEKRWTPAQAAAIEDEGGALLVSAAAGSGKTAVLVERACRLITRAKDPIPADRLLILTFTNAAAEELRGRIALRLEQELRARPQDLTLRRQRLLLGRAFIGTIDALCQLLVREHFSALEVPPDIAVGDAALLAGLSASALSDTMEQMYETNPDFAAFAALYGRARSDAAAEKAILNLYEFTRTLPHPARQLQRFASMYASGEPLADTLWGKELFNYAESALRAAARLLRSAMDIAGEDEALAPYLAALAEDEATVGAIASMVEKQRWDSAFAALQGYKFPAFKAIRGYEGGAKEAVKSLRDTVKDIFTDLKKHCFVCTEAEFEQDRADARPHIEALCAAVQSYEDRFYAAKLAEKVLDFADFEHLALRLLQTPEGERTPLAASISGRYDVVMVDEYQDTNELQDALYEGLARPDGANLFYVGDVKQSIYRFRKANPGLFLAKKGAWLPYGQGHPAVLTLGHNFRSGGGVIGGVNHIFETIMSPALGDIAYTRDERLIQGAAGGDDAGFELVLLEDAAGGGDEKLVAATIRRMVAEGYPVRDGDTTRPCNYGDFCVLLRARKNMLSFAAALEQQGIPTVADMAGELLQSPEVAPLAAALCAVDNPADDVSLAAAMLGPLFGFTAEQAARVRAAAPKATLWAALLQSDEPKAKQCAEQIRLWRAMAAQLPVGRLCEEMAAGYLSAVAAMEGGQGRLENLRRFIGWAAEASGSGRGGLPAFVRLLQGGKGPLEPPAKSLPGHVTILTIHKSKGLEFPICILADAAHSFNTMDLNERVQMHAELGIGLALRSGEALYPTLPALAVRQRTAAETLSEEMRVLYVALTRPKERMLITLPTKDAAKLLAAKAAQLKSAGADPFLLSRAKSLGEWVVTAALCHPDADALLEYTGGIIPPRLEAEGRFLMRVETADSAETTEQARYELTAPPDEALLAAVTARFAQTEARRPLAAVPRKVSVSALTKQGGQEEAIYRRPSFMYKTGLTAAERGSAQHAFMQHANLAAAGQSFAAELGRLVAEGFLRPEVAGAVDEAGVRSFLLSPLYMRMQGATQILREYDFITALPASAVQPELDPALAGEPVLVQGIADLVLVHKNGFELVDYKTDHKVDAATLRQRYTGQLALYAKAIEKRLELPLLRATIWSFSLNREIDIHL